MFCHLSLDDSTKKTVKEALGKANVNNYTNY
jgi:hypothetical protein